jgi:hypothetical protein
MPAYHCFVTAPSRQRHLMSKLSPTSMGCIMFSAIHCVDQVQRVLPQLVDPARTHLLPPACLQYGQGAGNVRRYGQLSSTPEKTKGTESKVIAS